MILEPNGYFELFRVHQWKRIGKYAIVNENDGLLLLVALVSDKLKLNVENGK